MSPAQTRNRATKRRSRRMLGLTVLGIAAACSVDRLDRDRGAVLSGGAIGAGSAGRSGQAAGDTGPGLGGRNQGGAAGDGEGREGVCKEETFQCSSDGTREECKLGVWTPNPCSNGDRCYIGECLACAPGAYQCVGAQLRKCNPVGTWVLVDSCGPENPICNPLTGSCVSTRVIGGFSALRTMTTPEVRVTGSFLVRPRLCANGTCVRGDFLP